MEFVLVVALTGALIALKWWRSGQPFLAFVFLCSVRLHAQLLHRWWCKQPDPLPPTGPVLLVSNHTSSADGIFLQSASTRLVGWMLSREHVESHPVVHSVFAWLQSVKVNRNGKDAKAARMGLRRLQEGRALGVFPEGNLSGAASGRLITAKAGAAWLALRSEATVIPVWIAGGPRSHRILDAWLWPSRQGVRVTFGKPIDMSQFRGQPINRKLVEEVSTCLMREIKALASRERWRPEIPPKSKN